jgi:signal peptidase I
VIVKCHELVPLIKFSLDRGQRINLSVVGASMMPFIKSGSTVDLASIEGTIRGDIVLGEIWPKKYVIHRIVKLNNGQVWLRGDANRSGEGPISRSSLIAKVVNVKFGRFCYNPGKGCGKFLGLLWISLFPLNIMFLGFCLRLRRAVKFQLKKCGI